MTNPQLDDVGPLLEHFFRTEYGRMVAVLVRMFRFEDIDIAEDIVQDTLLSACRSWGFGSIPENPHAWLMAVAKNKALNLLKHDKRRTAKLRIVAADPTLSPDRVTDPDEEHSMLELMFACCRPDLPREVQIPLVLKLLCGFGVAEIARALLIGEDATAKRIYRGKQRLQQESLSLDKPDDEGLKDRLNDVCTILYLMYTEGYRSTREPNLLRKDLCLEAMRLCKLLAHVFESEPQVYALLALMCFHTARFDTRVDDDGALVLLEDQDRSRWNTRMIQSGVDYLARAAVGDRLTAYHIEASIAAEHCLASSYASTNWRFIHSLYERLLERKPSPLIQLNLAIVASKLGERADAIRQLLAIKEGGSLDRYALLDASLGELMQQDGRLSEGLAYFRSALEKEASRTVCNHIENRIASIQDAITASGRSTVDR